MPQGLLLIDGNNVAHAQNCAQSLRVGEFPTQAIYGFVRALRPMVASYPMMTPVILWDGASWRSMVFKDYKGSRTREPRTKTDFQLQKQRAELKQQSKHIRLAAKLLGVRQMLALNWEADDLAGMMVNKARAQDRRVLMITGDKDWVQLVADGVSWYDPVRGDLLTMKTLPDKLGFHPGKGDIRVCNKANVEGFIGVPSPRAFLEMKALMGDKSDDIPGVGKIGDAGAIELLTKFGSVASFMNGCLDKSINYEALPKKFRDLATEMEKQDIFYRNMRLMDLNTKERPEPVNLTITPGGQDFGKFRLFCQELMFKSILDDFDNWCEPFKRLS